MEGLRVGKGGRVEGRKKGNGCGLEKGEGEVLRVGKGGWEGLKV